MVGRSVRSSLSLSRLVWSRQPKKLPGHVVPRVYILASRPMGKNSRYKITGSVEDSGMTGGRRAVERVRAGCIDISEIIPDSSNLRFYSDNPLGAQFA